MACAGGEQDGELSKACEEGARTVLCLTAALSAAIEENESSTNAVKCHGHEIREANLPPQPYTARP